VAALAGEQPHRRRNVVALLGQTTKSHRPVLLYTAGGGGEFLEGQLDLGGPMVVIIGVDVHVGEVVQIGEEIEAMRDGEEEEENQRNGGYGHTLHFLKFLFFENFPFFEYFGLFCHWNIFLREKGLLINAKSEERVS